MYKSYNDIDTLMKELDEKIDRLNKLMEAMDDRILILNEIAPLEAARQLNQLNDILPS